ncbi:MAG TPA: Ig-like domain-containing protein [Candidatus Dormibacteraeota bacterium]|nr:Ig-like domain-containing protein [Candidatus Dormibacteraeota bacterium]
MNEHWDPEVEEMLFEDPELAQIAGLLQQRQSPEPPLDPAFKSALRREVMELAWNLAEPKMGWWRRLVSPGGLAWGGATAGLAAVALIVMSVLGNLNSPPTVQLKVGDTQKVAVETPIVLQFGQAMNQASVQKALTIQPATQVSYEWTTASKLTIRPQGGTLAPNTQYTVQIGSGAETASNQALATTPPLVFITQPAPQQLAVTNDVLVGNASAVAPVWSADGSTLFYVDDGGQLQTYPKPFGSAGPTGVTRIAVAPDGVSVAYGSDTSAGFIGADGKLNSVVQNVPIRAIGWQVGPGSSGGLATAARTAATPTPTGQPATTTPATTRMVVVDGNAIVASGWGPTFAGTSQLASLPQPATAAWLSPDASHLIYSTSDAVLHLIDLSSAETTQPSIAVTAVSPNGLAWSSDSSEVGYVTPSGISVSDPRGANPVQIASLSDLSLQAGAGIDLAWSSDRQLLAADGFTLWALKNGGGPPIKLDSQPFSGLSWAPDNTKFAYLRGSQVRVDSLALLSGGGPLAEGGDVLSRFMAARIGGTADTADQFLDASGKLAYTATTARLLVNSDSRLTRYYVVLAEIVDSSTLRYTVRLVLSKNGRETSFFDENLLLTRDASSGKFVIDQSQAGPETPLGRGPTVVAFSITHNQILVTFDSDLEPGSIAGATTLTGADGRPIDLTPTYNSRILTLKTAVNLIPKASYTLTISAAVKDINGASMICPYLATISGPTG